MGALRAVRTLLEINPLHGIRSTSTKNPITKLSFPLYCETGRFDTATRCFSIGKPHFFTSIRSWIASNVSALDLIEKVSILPIIFIKI